MAKCIAMGHSGGGRGAPAERRDLSHPESLSSGESSPRVRPCRCREQRESDSAFRERNVMAHLLRIAVLSGIVLLFSPAWAGAQTAGKNPPVPSAKGAPALSCLVIAPQSLRFDRQDPGTKSPPQCVILTNRSKNDLTLRLSVAGDFLLDAPPNPLPLRSGASTAAVVRFTPRREGAAAGALTVMSGCADEPRLRVVPLWGGTPGWLGLLCSDALLANFALALVLGLLYWMAMVVVRWNRVAMPSRFVLRAQIASVDAELEALREAAAPVPPPTHATELLQAARRLIDGPRPVSGNRLLNYLFWSRGQEITGWGYTYEAQKLMVPLMPEPAVRARLETTAAALDLADDVPCRALAGIAKGTLALQPPPPLERLRAVLTQALSAHYDREYNSYADLVSWQNKTSWLVGCGLLLIVVLTSAFPNQSIFFLVGATGGLLSRLSRSLNRKAAPTDYGASWTTLFLSPVAGALGAWVGILIAALAVNLKILNEALGGDWNKAHEPATLAVALAFGFSERLLDSV